MDYFSKGQSDIFKLEIDENAKGNFLEMCRWTKFIAILGFVLLGIMVVIGLLVVVFLTAAGETTGPQGQAIVPMLLAMALAFLYIYPTYTLLKYSTCIKKALTTDDKGQFNLAIKYLKNTFKFMGILLIVVLAIYGIALIFVVIKTVGR